MESKKYTKRPVEIEAIKWTGENLADIIAFTGKHPKFNEWFNSFEAYEAHVKADGGIFKIFTLEGVMEASIGDYIIRGVQGEHYPCKPDIFAKTYVLSELKSAHISEARAVEAFCQATCPGRTDICKVYGTQNCPAIKQFLSALRQ